ncbi:MAG: glycosyltransferase family 2 protein [Prevotella sp.]|nr:glycosyltransferase family 2 protein [Prevotella sp.]MBQ3361083.1 glycosyltransferase family 2 protein [Prevotella sp.]
MTTESPKISVILAVHDQSQSLEQNLSQFLTPQGDIPYEVIVVDDSSTDETPDILKRFKADYPQLYTTFLPKSKVPYPSRLRLALTVGAKAAHSKLILISDITRPPLSDQWLATLLSNIDESADVTLIYHDKSNIFQMWDSLDEAAPYVLKAERKSKRGHRGRFFLFLRGLYSDVLVKKSMIHELLKLFDQKVGGLRLEGLRFKVMWSNLTNR